jgi:enoyl-CoA hydratase/carnithine racemase
MEKIHINYNDDDDHKENQKATPSANITKLVLNRPKANAMGYEFVQTLQGCLQGLDDTRCVVITSHSDRVFSAGADLKERATLSLQQTEDFVSLLRATLDDVSTLPVPVIAAIEGVAVGGGFELALAADIRIAGSDATLGLPETSLGIIPGAGGTQRLPRLIGIGRAKQLIWTGRKLSAADALRYGVVEEVVPAGTATEVALALGVDIAKSGPVAIRASKQSILHGLDCSTMKEALEIEGRCYAQTLPTKDRLEGLAAFKDGRKPKYTGQ